LTLSCVSYIIPFWLMREICKLLYSCTKFVHFSLMPVNNQCLFRLLSNYPHYLPQDRGYLLPSLSVVRNFTQLLLKKFFDILRPPPLLERVRVLWDVLRGRLLTRTLVFRHP